MLSASVLPFTFGSFCFCLFLCDGGPSCSHSIRIWGLFKNSDKSTSEIFQWVGLMWILGKEISLLLCSKSTISRGKMNQKNKKDTGHYLKQNGHEKQTAKQVLCTIIDQKGKRLRFGKQIFLNTDIYRARRHFNVLWVFFFNIIYAKKIYDHNISSWFLKWIISKRSFAY